MFVCLTESLLVSVTQKYCSSPNYHLTSIKGTALSAHQATSSNRENIWRLVVYWSSLFPVSQSQFLQRSTHSSLCAGFGGNVVYVFVIKCENTSVGEDFKELCLCFSGTRSRPTYWNLSNLRLNLLCSSSQTIWPYLPHGNVCLHFSLIKQFVCICCCALLTVWGILWKRNALLKWKISERYKPQKQKCGKKREVHRQVSWNLPHLKSANVYSVMKETQITRPQETHKAPQIPVS